MRLFTTTVTGSFTISRDQNILQWSVAAADPSTVFTIQGIANVNSTASTAVGVGGSAGTGVYNSGVASTQSTWDGVTITVSAGSVSLVMTQE
jgi:hypothetical protein